ncbi:MAG: hypothetical protein ACI86H_001239 [bacterium]|jgi:hypothetical protein
MYLSKNQTNRKKEKSNPPSFSSSNEFTDEDYASLHITDETISSIINGYKFDETFPKKKPTKGAKVRSYALHVPNFSKKPNQN